MNDKEFIEKASITFRMDFFKSLKSDRVLIRINKIKRILKEVSK